MTAITYTPIGVVHSPFATAHDMPLQTVAAHGVQGSIELYPEYRVGLKDLDGFSHLLLVTHLHLMTESAVTVVPFLDTQPHGIFATRSPKRPNPIGLSLVRLLSITDGILRIEDVDLVDGTPLLDIKPYVPAFDSRETDRIGWFWGRLDKVFTVRSDNRFS